MDASAHGHSFEFEFDTDPLDTRAAIRSAKRHLVTFDARSSSLKGTDGPSWQTAAVAYATLLAHESNPWITKHRALDRFLDKVFRPVLRLASKLAPKDAAKESVPSTVAMAVSWYQLYTDPANGILFHPASLNQSQPLDAVSLVFSNPTTASQATLRSDWPPSLQLAALTTAADMARALVYGARNNAAQYLQHAQSYLLAARSLFPGCGKVDRSLAVLALAVRAQAPVHHIPTPPQGLKSEAPRKPKKQGVSASRHATKPATVWAIPSVREVDSLYHLTCAECAATDPSPDHAALDKLLQPVHEWDMLGPTAQALHARQEDGLVLAPVSALLAWYCRLHSRTSLERVPQLTACLLDSLPHLDPDHQCKVAVLAIGLAFRLRTVPTVTSFVLESLISLMCYSTASSPALLVWTALTSRGILAYPLSALSHVSPVLLQRLASHLNKVSNGADPFATVETHRWLSGLDPTLYPYPLTMPLDRSEIHDWWSQHLQEEASSPLAYDPTNPRTPFTIKPSDIPAPALSSSTAAPKRPEAPPPVLVLTSSTPRLSTRTPSLDSLSTPSPPSTPMPFYVFDTNTVLNHLSILYQPLVPLTLPLAVMYELEGLQRAPTPAVARHARRAWTALMAAVPGTKPPPAAGTACAAVDPATAPLAIFTSRGSKLALAQVARGVSEDYRQRGGLDNVVLDTCVALARAGNTAGAPRRVVLVTEDLNLRLKAQARKIDTCGVHEVPGLEAKEDPGLPAGEQVLFGGHLGKKEAKRGGRRAGPKTPVASGKWASGDPTRGGRGGATDTAPRQQQQRATGDKGRRRSGPDTHPKRNDEQGTRLAWTPRGRQSHGWAKRSEGTGDQ